MGTVFVPRPENFFGLRRIKLRQCGLSSFFFKQPDKSSGKQKKKRTNHKRDSGYINGQRNDGSKESTHFRAGAPGEKRIYHFCQWATSRPVERCKSGFPSRCQWDSFYQSGRKFIYPTERSEYCRLGRFIFPVRGTRNDSSSQFQLCCVQERGFHDFGFNFRQGKSFFNRYQERGIQYSPAPD